MPKITAERIIDAGGNAFTPGAIGQTTGARAGGGTGIHLLATTDGLGDQHTVFGLWLGKYCRLQRAMRLLLHNWRIMR